MLLADGHEAGHGKPGVTSEGRWFEPSCSDQIGCWISPTSSAGDHGLRRGLGVFTRPAYMIDVLGGWFKMSDDLVVIKPRDVVAY